MESSDIAVYIVNPNQEGRRAVRATVSNASESDLLVSVVTAVYDGALWLEQAICSVLTQTYPFVEYILIDGGSSDGSVEIIKKYAAEISYWVSEPDNGIYDAMNKGIAKCSGEIVGILNSDDWYERHTLEIVASIFYQYAEVDLVYGAMNIRSPDGILEKRYGSREKLKDIYSAPFNHPACFVRRRVYNEVGIFENRFSTAADYDFMLRFKKQNKSYAYIDATLTNFRKGGVTSKSYLFPASQLWRILKKNNVPLKYRVLAIGHRTLKMVFASVGSQLKRLVGR